MGNIFELPEFGVVDIDHGHLIYIGGDSEGLGCYRALMSCPKDKYVGRTPSSLRFLYHVPSLIF